MNHFSLFSTIFFICFRMDSSSACRIAARVPNYVEVCDDGSHVVHPDSNLELVVDRDSTNLMDIKDEIAKRVKHGSNQGISVCYWNRTVSAFTNVTSDASLMDAMDLYWEMRRLPLFVAVYDTVTVEHSQSVSVEPSAHHVGSASVATEPLPLALIEYVAEDETEDVVANNAETGTTKTKAKSKRGKGRKRDLSDDEEPWDEDEVEYVGLNDEHPYLSDVEEQLEHEGQSTDGDCSELDDLFVDDEAGCEIVEHVTDLENPTIALGVTFEDGDTFKRAIRQFAVLNEFEIDAHYSEAKRYRGFCKGRSSKKKKCRWRIHASELQDGKTWQVTIPAFNYVIYSYMWCIVCFMPL